MTSERMRKKVPVLCDLKPSGKYVAVDLHQAGGIPQVMKILLSAGLMNGDCITITGKTIAETLKDIPDTPRADQDVIMPMDKALYKQGAPGDPQGQLWPPKVVWPRSRAQEPRHHRPARVFDSEPQLMEAIMADKINHGDVIVLRYEGPCWRPRHARDAGAHQRTDR